MENGTEDHYVIQQRQVVLVFSHLGKLGANKRKQNKGHDKTKVMKVKTKVMKGLLGRWKGKEKGEEVE
jgi:hypothetical protein